MLAMQRKQWAMFEVQRFERIAALERRIFEHAFAAFDQVERELASPVKVNEPPAANEVVETSKAAKPATPKRTTAKPITAQFEPLNASNVGESEGSQNGHATFRSPR